MAGSRLDRIGTIFSRTTGLIKAGAVSYQDRPIWYDVYRVFPPKYEPRIDRQPETEEVSVILYQEDQYRSLFFKKYGFNPGGVARKLGDRGSSEPSQTFVDVCLRLQKKYPEWDTEKIFNEATGEYKPEFSSAAEKRKLVGGVAEDYLDTEENLASMRRTRTVPKTISAQSLLELFKEAKGKQEDASKRTEPTPGDKAKE